VLRARSQVCVVGNPANTNALIAQACAPSIPKENFTALTRLDQNRAKGFLAKKLRVSPGQIHNAIIWGNHSSTQFPDLSHGQVDTDGRTAPLKEALGSGAGEWVEKEFIPGVQQRGAAVIKARQKSSAASAANAIVGHVHDWLVGTPQVRVAPTPCVCVRSLLACRTALIVCLFLRDRASGCRWACTRTARTASPRASSTRSRSPALAATGPSFRCVPNQPRDV
jgi:malate/lactate dehydrogenase